jgi:hypothetical protein
MQQAKVFLIVALLARHAVSGIRTKWPSSLIAASQDKSNHFDNESVCHSSQSKSKQAF